MRPHCNSTFLLATVINSTLTQPYAWLWLLLQQTSTVVNVVWAETCSCSIGYLEGLLELHKQPSRQRCRFDGAAYIVQSHAINILVINDWNANDAFGMKYMTTMTENTLKRTKAKAFSRRRVAAPNRKYPKPRGRFLRTDEVMGRKVSCS